MNRKKYQNSNNNNKKNKSNKLLRKKMNLYKKLFRKIKMKILFQIIKN